MAESERLGPRFIVQLRDVHGSPVRVVVERQQLRNLIKAATVVTDSCGDSSIDVAQSGEVQILRLLDGVEPERW